MPIEIRPFEEKDRAQVKQFNQRLIERHAPSIFPEDPISDWLPKQENFHLYQDRFVAVDESAVRGGYMLKHQEFLINGQAVSIADFQLPISEGIIDKKYAGMGLNLMANAMSKTPLLYGLGMGGYSEPLPQLMMALKWDICEVPFYFKISHPFAFLRKNSFLRRKQSRRLLLDFMAFSGLGWLGITTLQKFKQRRKKFTALRFAEVRAFDDKANGLWEQVKGTYKLIAVRDKKVLDVLYPSSSKRFIRLEIFKNDSFAGWVVVLDTQMTKHRQFGSLRIGSIVDCLSHPSDADAILSIAHDFLVQRGVDLIVANHSHQAWGKSFLNLGFIKGPSNFLFAVSKQLSQIITSFKTNKDFFFLMRGDGDGPINL